MDKLVTIRILCKNNRLNLNRLLTIGKCSFNMIITDSATLWPLNIWGAARRSVKAMAVPLASTATRRRDITGVALRVSLSTPTDCVACMDVGEGREQDAVSFASLDKGLAIICKTRLDVNVDKLTELAIIMWKEH